MANYTTNEAKLLRTYDWRFTEAACRTFQDTCYQALADAQVTGRGYFMEAEAYKLEKAMIDAIHEADYVKVANYAMMLHTQQQIEKERKEWLRPRPVSPAQFNELYMQQPKAPE